MYNEEELFEKAKVAIKDHNLFFISDIAAFIGISRETFYRYWPTDSNKYDTLSKMLDENKTKTKSAIRAKLFKGGKASELIPLYKLIANEEERKILTQRHLDVKSDGEKLENQAQIIINLGGGVNPDEDDD